MEGGRQAGRDERERGGGRDESKDKVIEKYEREMRVKDRARERERDEREI